MNIKLIRASLADAELIWKMQIKSFAGLLEKYQDYDTNPGNETLEKVIFRLKQDFTYFYLINVDEETAGAIRVVDMKEPGKSKRISPIFILDEYRDQGIAQEAMKCAEAIHGENYWQLDTILQEKGNCHLYEKMGYHKTGKTQKVNEKLTLVFYEK